MAVLWVKFLFLAIFLAAHALASWKKWYYKKPEIDTITHILGGLVLGAFIKDWTVGFALIIAWEAMEVLLIRENRRAFREAPLNKARDIIVGAIGFLFGLDML